MSRLNETLATLTVAVGALESNTLASQLTPGQLRTALHFMDDMTIRAPRNLTESANIQVSPVRNPSASDWITTTTIELLPSGEILDEWGVVITDETAALNPLITEGLGTGASVIASGEVFWDLRVVLSDPADAERQFKVGVSMLVSAGG